jgi:thiamine biosynthesis lipoprotein
VTQTTTLSAPVLHLARHHRQEVMGTVVTIDVFSDGQLEIPRLASHIGRACRILQSADEVFSTWKSDSPMSKLRRAELRIDQVPHQIAEVLDLCRAARLLTDGWFDPWALPGGIDPTGYVKGWAAQRALGALAVPGVQAAIVNAAGDIASFITTPQVYTTPFRFGIVDPFDRSNLACIVEHTGAVATSGTYERGNHLINPVNRRPTTQVASATVTGVDLGLADALATALAVGGNEVLALIAALDDYEAMTISHEGDLNKTAGFPDVPLEG